MNFEIIPSQQTPKVPDITDVELFYIQNIEKLQAFIEYAQTRNDAVGLAANQVSLDGERLNLRVFALRKLHTDNWRLIVNPVITEHIGIKDIKCEGCLTWVGKVVVAERSRAIRVSYYDELGVRHSEEYKGFEAQIWQHEINHLDGINEVIEERNYVEPKLVEVNRNDRCPCGSGKKYKQCCIIL